MITNITRTLTLIATVFTIGQVLAAEPVKIRGSVSKHDQERTLQRALNKHLSYPLMEKEDMTGEVFVSFVVNKEGNLEVLDCSSANERLKQYVIRKLARINIGNNPTGVWKTTHMSISFRSERT